MNMYTLLSYLYYFVNHTSLQLWSDESQGNASTNNYYINNNSQLVFNVSRFSLQRPKLKTNTQFKFGIFEWQVYIPQFNKNDITSVGNFLYYDDLHEFDWECGYGNSNVRTILNILDDNTKSVCFMTSQSTNGKSSNYLDSSYITISGNKWYNLKIQLTYLSRNSMTTQWYINDTLVKTSIQKWSVQNLKRGMNAYISLENLPFMGNYINSTILEYNIANWTFFKFSQN